MVRSTATAFCKLFADVLFQVKFKLGVYRTTWAPIAHHEAAQALTTCILSWIHTVRAHET